MYRDPLLSPGCMFRHSVLSGNEPKWDDDIVVLRSLDKKLYCFFTNIVSLLNSKVSFFFSFFFLFLR